MTRAVLRRPAMALRASGLIRWHGLVLWLRRLPVVPRQPHHAPPDVSASGEHCGGEWNGAES